MKIEPHNIKLGQSISISGLALGIALLTYSMFYNVACGARSGGEDECSRRRLLHGFGRHG